MSSALNLSALEAMNTLPFELTANRQPSTGLFQRYLETTGYMDLSLHTSLEAVSSELYTVWNTLNDSLEGVVFRHPKKCRKSEQRWSFGPFEVLNADALQECGETYGWFASPEEAKDRMIMAFFDIDSNDNPTL